MIWFGRLEAHPRLTAGLPRGLFVCLLGETEWLPQPKPWKDTYWSGTAPLCLGGCRARHRELKYDRCGDSSCCWVGFKSLCRGGADVCSPVAVRLVETNGSPPSASCQDRISEERETFVLFCCFLGQVCSRKDVKRCEMINTDAPQLSQPGYVM